MADVATDEPEPCRNANLLPRRLADLHAHILPALDDGARDEVETLAMLRAAVADGITTIVATPHAHHVTPEIVLTRLERARELAAEAALPIEILPGSEARIMPEIIERQRQGLLLTLNGTSWLLLELYLNDEWPLRLVAQSVARVQAGGLRPILAHPERYPFAQRDPDALLPFITRGVPLQLNAGSLLGKNGGVAQRAAETLVRRRMAHLLASDAHSVAWSPPVIRPALARVAALADPAYAGWLADNAMAVIAGRELALPAPLADD